MLFIKILVSLNIFKLISPTYLLSQRSGRPGVDGDKQEQDI